MELLVPAENTLTGVNIYQDGEHLRAVTECCGLAWERNGFELSCTCGIYTVKTFLHKEHVKLEKHMEARADAWVRIWTGLVYAKTEVRWT